MRRPDGPDAGRRDRRDRGLLRRRRLIRRGDGKALEDAAELLIQWQEVARIPFPSAHFRWNLAVIDLAEKTGDRQTAVEAARRALDLADRGPVFPRHKTVGVVDAEHQTLERLRGLAK